MSRAARPPSVGVRRPTCSLVLSAGTGHAGPGRPATSPWPGASSSSTATAGSAAPSCASSGAGWCCRAAARSSAAFRLEPAGFLVDGEPVTLVVPKRPDAPGRTASGSIPVAGARAIVAQPSRIWVEGVHDAELVERVWGDDLRVEGVAVERLDGIDVLADAVRRFAPGPGRRLGVLVDHLVPGSKEARLASSVASPHVLVTGTPYVDVWEAVRPKVLGIPAWPEIPRGVPWKDGVCGALGWARARRRLAAHPRVRAHLRRPRTGPGRRRRAAHRLRDRARRVATRTVGPSRVRHLRCVDAPRPRPVTMPEPVVPGVVPAFPPTFWALIAQRARAIAGSHDADRRPRPPDDVRRVRRRLRALRGRDPAAPRDRGGRRGVVAAAHVHRGAWWSWAGWRASASCRTR